MRRFGDALARLRRESGFQTPYAFYHKNGGRRVFPFTYAYYLKIERGKSLPRASWLPLMLTLMRITPTEDMYRRFVTSYFQDVCGDAETFEQLVGPLMCRHAKSRPEKQAAKRLMTEKAYHMTPEQYKAITASPEACWTFECLCNDRKGFTADEIAGILEMPVARIRAAIKSLVAKKLAKETRGGLYTSPLVDKFYVVPRKYKGIEKDEARILSYEKKMTERLGAVIFRNGLMLRAEEGAIRKAIQSFTDGMETANAYATSEKGDATGVFVLQTRVRRLFWL